MKMNRKENNNELVRRWSLRKVSTGVASVVVASGFFFLAPGQVTVHADTPSQTFVSTEADATVLDTSVTVNNENAVPVEAVPEVKTQEVTSTTPVETPKEAVQTSEEVSVKSVVSNESSVQVSPEEFSSSSKEDIPSDILTESKNAVEDSAKEVTPVEKVQEAVKENVKENTDVKVSYLTNAQSPGPFTAGVNQVIPYEFFGGDGMLTRLLLKSSDTAPWSDNGKDKNPFLLPVEKLGNGQYFYQVALDGNAAGKQDKALLDQLQADGTQDYKATVLVYGVKDGKADLNNVVATRVVKVHLNGATTVDQVKEAVQANVKESTDVPVSFLTNAQSPGPFTAGVNQVIPYEFFGGDGMLTRLLLKSSDTAPWSDNGKDKNPFLLPVEKLGNGQYFYQVALDGNAAGKQDKALLDQLQANGTHQYTATVLVYGAKDGKADLNNVVAVRTVLIQLNGIEQEYITDQEFHSEQVLPNAHKHENGTKVTQPAVMNHMVGNQTSHSPVVEQTATSEKEHAKQMVKEDKMMSQNHSMMSDKKEMLPNTGETSSASLTLVGGMLLSLLGFFGLRSKKED